MCKVNFIAEERLNLLVVNEKLNNLEGVNQTESPILTMLSLTEESPKYKWSPGVTFPAIVKKSAFGLAVYNCVTGRKEIIKPTGYKEPSPVGDNFEYKNRRYVKKDTINGIPRYVGEK